MTVAYAEKKLVEAFMAPPQVHPMRLAALRQAATSNVLGIADVCDEEELARLVDKDNKARQGVQKKYEQDARELYAKCEHAGLPHIRVMPQAAWTKLCDTAGLILLKPDDQRQVGISSPYPLWNLGPEVRRRADALDYRSKLLAVLGAFATLFAVCAIAAIYALPPGAYLAAVFGGLLAYPIVRALTRGKMFLDRNTPSDYGYAKIARRLLAKACAEYEHPNLAFFPNLREGKDARVKMYLPTPPADVVETLRKARAANLPMQVRVVPEAIRFDADPVDILAKTHAAQTRATREAEIANRRDPIIEVTHGSAVAVIAQYGDFPIEKALIDTVAAEDFATT